MTRRSMKEVEHDCPGHHPRLSKPIIDKIDSALAEHYGFRDEELDFIINYGIRYRMGRNSDQVEEGNE